MLCQYKNFRSRELISKKKSKEAEELFKMVILLVIINLVLFSIYCSEKSTYENKKLNEKSSCNINITNKQLLISEKNNKIIDIMNDNELCSLCSSMECSNDGMKLECSSMNVDMLYDKLKKHNFIKKCDMEGDSSKFIFKLVIN